MSCDEEVTVAFDCECLLASEGASAVIAVGVAAAVHRGTAVLSERRWRLTRALQAPAGWHTDSEAAETPAFMEDFWRMQANTVPHTADSLHRIGEFWLHKEQMRQLAREHWNAPWRQVVALSEQLQHRDGMRRCVEDGGERVRRIVWEDAHLMDSLLQLVDRDDRTRRTDLESGADEDAVHVHVATPQDMGMLLHHLLHNLRARALEDGMRYTQVVDTTSADPTWVNDLLRATSFYYGDWALPMHYARTYLPPPFAQASYVGQPVNVDSLTMGLLLAAGATRWRAENYSSQALAKHVKHAAAQHRKAAAAVRGNTHVCDEDARFILHWYLCAAYDHRALVDALAPRA